MGIKYLQHFMLNKCPGGAKEIDMKKEIEKHKRDFNIEKPVIVIDVSSIHQYIYTNEKEKLFAGRYDLYNIRTEETLKKLTQLGVEIICVLDGSLYEDKTTTVLQRKTQRYNKERKILQKIENDKNLLNSKQKLYVPDLTPYFYNFRLIAEKYCTVITSTREGDQEVAYQANQRNALAVISHDSDFLIFNGNWQFWSGSHMNLSKYSIIHFDKVALREYFKLSPSQIILFGTLSGNDYVKYEMVEKFHKKCGYNRFDKIAEIVRRSPSLPPRLTIDDENYLIEKIFEEQNRTIGRQDFRKSIHFYYDINEPNTYPSPLLEKASYSSFLYSILLNIPLNINLFYFDLNKKDFKPFYQLIQPILQRQIGTISKACGEDVNQTRQIMTKLKHEDSYEIIQEQCVLPNDDLQSLENFILIPTSKTDNLYKLKLKLFCWQILPQCTYFTPVIISNLPDKMVLQISTIAYLIENNQISIEEADCILFACSYDFEKEQSVNISNFKIINERDARVAFLFTRLHNVMVGSVQILGLTNYESLNTFDGVYYHYLRYNYEKENKLILSLKDQYKKMRIYSKNTF